MPTTKSTLHKSIVAQGHCWVIVNNGNFKLEVEMYEKIGTKIYEQCLKYDRAFLEKGEANSALAIIESVLKHSKKD